MSFEVPDWSTNESFSYYDMPSVDSLNIVEKRAESARKRNLESPTSLLIEKKQKADNKEEPHAAVSPTKEEKKKAKKEKQKEALKLKKNEVQEKEQVTSQPSQKKNKNKYKEIYLKQKQEQNKGLTAKPILNGLKIASQTDSTAVAHKENKKRKKSENGEAHQITKKQKKMKNTDEVEVFINGEIASEGEKEEKQMKKNKNKGNKESNTLVEKKTVKEKTKKQKKNKSPDDVEEIVDVRINVNKRQEDESPKNPKNKKRKKSKQERELVNETVSKDHIEENEFEEEEETMEKEVKRKAKEHVVNTTQEVGKSKKKKKQQSSANEITKGKKEVKKQKINKDIQKFEKKIMQKDDDEDVDPMLTSDLDSLLKELNFEQFPTEAFTVKDDEISDIEEDSDGQAESDIDTDDLLESSDENEVEDEDEDENESEGEEEEEKRDQKSASTSQSIPDDKKVQPKSESSPKKISSLSKNKLMEALKEAKTNTSKNSKESPIKKESPQKDEPKMTSAEALKQKMLERLKAAQFRMMNEDLYTKSSASAVQQYKDDSETFERYHEGFQMQVALWPVNPLDVIITWLKKKPRDWVVADLGCGEAKLAATVPQKQVHSFDLVALNNRVTPCDMSRTPLKSDFVDVVVFCLSLMGTNVKDFLLEANRILKEGGLLKIAEVESRLNKVDEFVKNVSQLGFRIISKETKQKYFHMFLFKKTRNCKKSSSLPDIILKPCIYKKR